MGDGFSLLSGFQRLKKAHLALDFALQAGNRMEEGIYTKARTQIENFLNIAQEIKK